MTAHEELDTAYAKVPVIENCKGLCWDSCTSIEASPVELQRIEDVSGIVIENRRGDTTPCPALGGDKLCQVYEVRPMICRLFGTSKSFACEHGCAPSQPLSLAEGFELLNESFLIGGKVPGSPDPLPPGELTRIVEDWT